MPALPPLYALQAFLAAADCGSFTGAATRLNLTQGAVSRQVQLLEEYYGCPLFVRQARGLTLTPEGLELLAPVRQAMQTLTEAGARVRRGADVLRVQFPPTMAVRWFLPRLPALQAELPGLEIRVATHWTDAPDFSNSDADAIIAHGKGGWPQLAEVPLMRERLVPLCTPEMAASLREPSDLASATLLHATPQRHEWLMWLRGAGVPDLQGAREQLFDTVDMCVQSAERGLGVAIADAALFTDLIASQKVVKPFDIEVDSGNGYFLTYPSERREQRNIRRFEEWLVSALGV
ncbi:DNA-binding transcriptional regulator, LysR family [Polaromonas sp. YR568]|uniref:LysR substrate-binding domain-containing protein n=1 Tax=Polaromonas sp. YR568 TaxID=1855301 RepID=UPI0008E283F3|nr:LysR substrate-binding domain-containing protein [Polaromonas sp. YR568]SFV04143.1 DNA-binding transcriptional regulator, LysR family [Polaromonas sp. YR568]